MDKRAIIFASVLSGVFVLGVILLSVYRTSTRLQEAQVATAQARAEAEKTALQMDELKRKIAESEKSIQELQKEKEMATQTQHSLEQEMRNALESKDVTISQLQGKLTVNILDRVMFDSGEAVLKNDGATVLHKVGKLLAQHPELKIHVIGHTDNIPIRASARSRFPSNWELSTARATAAVRYLTETGGVDPRRVGAVGYGEFRPIADNATPEGRAKNRRIAITVLSEELAGADVVPTTRTNGIAPKASAPATNETTIPTPLIPPEEVTPTTK